MEAARQKRSCCRGMPRLHPPATRKEPGTRTADRKPQTGAVRRGRVLTSAPSWGVLYLEGIRTCTSCSLSHEGRSMVEWRRYAWQQRLFGVAVLLFLLLLIICL